MSDIENGWLRVVDSKFYAYTRPEAMVMNEDTGETFKEYLGDFDVHAVENMIESMQIKINNLTRLVEDLVTGSTAMNTQTGVYTANKDDIDDLHAHDRLDDNVLYIVPDDPTTSSRVYVTIHWRNKTGEKLGEDVLYDNIGADRGYDFFGKKTFFGRTYNFKPGESHAIDAATGVKAKNVDDSAVADTATLYFTKNQVLDIYAI